MLTLHYYTPAISRKALYRVLDRELRTERKMRVPDTPRIRQYIEDRRLRSETCGHNTLIVTNC